MKKDACSLWKLLFKPLATAMLSALAGLNGCSSWQETTYHAVQNYNQLQCEKNPTANCPKGQSYGDYQRQTSEPPHDSPN